MTRYVVTHQHRWQSLWPDMNGSIFFFVFQNNAIIDKRAHSNYIDTHNWIDLIRREMNWSDPTDQNKSLDWRYNSRYKLFSLIIVILWSRIRKLNMINFYNGFPPTQSYIRNRPILYKHTIKPRALYKSVPFWGVLTELNIPFPSRRCNTRRVWELRYKKFIFSLQEVDRWLQTV